MFLILPYSARGKLQHTLPLNQKKNPLLLNTISNPAAVTLSPSGLSDRFLFTSITFVEIYRKSVIRCCKPLQDMVYYLRGDCGMKLFDKYFQPYAEYCSSF